MARIATRISMGFPSLVLELTALRSAPARARTVHLKSETCNLFLESWCYHGGMATWGFLTKHARALLCIADDPGARLRDVAANVGVTERRAHAIITDLVDDGYVVKERDGRRNRYRVQADLPLRDPIRAQRTVGELLDLLVGATPHREGADHEGPAAEHVATKR